jgi:hypothetical protein
VEEPEIIADWGLRGELGGEAAAEPIVLGKMIRMAEGPFGRLVILVCEDLSRTIADGSALSQVGPSLCLAPVLSKPTLAHYWEHSRAKDLSSEIGSTVVVSNSLVIEDRQRAADLPVDAEGTMVAHGPGGFVVGHAAEPGEVLVVRLHPDAIVAIT